MKSIHTFVVLAYKESSYLEECVKSVLNQKYKSEVVIATATYNKYIEQIAKKYKLKIIENKNHIDIGHDFDFAINCASTELVTVAHQDDIYDYEYSYKMVEMYKKYPDSSMIFPDYYEVRENKNVYKNRLLRVKRFLRLPLIFHKIAHTRFIKRLSIRFGCSIMCPSITFVKKNIPDTCYSSPYKVNVDWYCYEKLSRINGRWSYVNKPLMGHRIHEESTTSEFIKNESIRTKEDFESFTWFWPSSVAKFLNLFYKSAQKSNDSNYKKKNKTVDIILLVICFLLTFFRLFLDLNIPMFLQANAIYDDRLLFDYAVSISNSSWLGLFGQLTLAKPIGYPLFVVIAHKLSIPLSMFTIIFYIISLWVLIVALRKIIANKYFLTFLYIALLFCPITFGVGAFKVVYRNGVQIASTIFVVATAIGLFTRRDNVKKHFLWILFNSAFLSFFYIVKEDGIWLLPFEISALVITGIYLFFEFNKKIKKQMLLLFIPIVMLIVTVLSYCYVNYHKYGVFTITDRTGTYFHLVLEDMMKIKSDHTAYSWVTKDAFEQAVNVSPSLQLYKDALDDNMYLDWGLTEDGELQTDLFYWRLRYSLAVGGLYNSSGYEVNEFYKNVHSELQQAFDDGILQVDDGFHISSSLPYYSDDEFNSLISQIFPMLNILFNYSIIQNDIALYESTGSIEQIQEVKDYTLSKIYNADDNNYIVNMVFNIEKNIANVYMQFGLMFGIVGIIGNLVFIIKSVTNFFKKKFDNLSQFLIELGLMATFMLYFTIILWFSYKFTNRVGIFFGYMHPAHILLNILTIIGIYNLFNIMFDFCKTKFYTKIVK